MLLDARGYNERKKHYDMMAQDFGEIIAGIEWLGGSRLIEPQWYKSIEKRATRTMLERFDRFFQMDAESKVSATSRPPYSCSNSSPDGSCLESRANARDE
jgi:hypothetical protein